MDSRITSEKTLMRAIEPYYNEATHCFLIDLFVIVFCSFAGILMKFQDFFPQYFYILPLFILVECFFNYRLAILIRIEKYFGLYETNKLIIHSVNRKWFFTSGKYGSIVGKLYPEKLGIDSFRIVCFSQDRKIVLHSIMSQKKYIMLIELMEESNTTVSVEYGKLSHVIVAYKGNSDSIKMLNHWL